MIYSPSFRQPGYPLSRTRGFASLGCPSFAFYKEVCSDSMLGEFNDFTFQANYTP
jgi:hypothetical protein